MKSAREKAEKRPNSELPPLVVDGMLGSLARKLRIYGFDTLYERDVDDKTLLKESNEMSRVLVTSDSGLAARSKKLGANCILVKGADDAERLCALMRGLGVKPSLDPSRSRCPLCNGELSPEAKEAVADVVPKKVLALHEKFFVCRSCGKAYWEGGHWVRLESFDSRLRECFEGRE